MLIVKANKGLTHKSRHFKVIYLKLAIGDGLVDILGVSLTNINIVPIQYLDLIWHKRNVAILFLEHTSSQTNVQLIIKKLILPIGLLSLASDKIIH